MKGSVLAFTKIKTFTKIASRFCVLGLAQWMGSNTIFHFSSGTKNNLQRFKFSNYSNFRYFVMYSLCHGGAACQVIIFFRTSFPADNSRYVPILKQWRFILFDMKYKSAISLSEKKNLPRPLVTKPC